MSELVHKAKIDFDHWSAQADSDPEAFEARRSELLQGVIDKAPAHRQRRLRGLQWQLDQVRESAGTPIAACVRMSEMMWDSVLGDGGLRDTLGLLLEPPAEAPKRQDAVVLQFHSPRGVRGRDLS